MAEPAYKFTYTGRGREVSVHLDGADLGLRDVLDGMQNFLQAVGFVFAVGERLDVWNDDE